MITVILFRCQRLCANCSCCWGCQPQRALDSPVWVQGDSGLGNPFSSHPAPALCPCRSLLGGPAMDSQRAPGSKEECPAGLGLSRPGGGPGGGLDDSASPQWQDLYIRVCGNRVSSGYEDMACRWGLSPSWPCWGKSHPLTHHGHGQTLMGPSCTPLSPRHPLQTVTRGVQKLHCPGCQPHVPPSVEINSL